MTPKKFLIAAILFGILLTTAYSLLTSFTFAFNPPTGSGGSGGGAIGVDVSNNLAIGTSTSGLDSRVLIYATSSNAFILKVVSPTSSPILVVKNDGRVGIATSTPTSTLTVQGDLTVTGIIYGIFNGQLDGTVSAANVSNGVFGSLVGSGNYSFPSSLGIATSSQIGLPQQLSVYGGAYISGNVGIGTMNPQKHLQIEGNDLVNPITLKIVNTALSSDTANSRIEFQDGTSGPDFVIHFNAPNNQLRFQDSAGNVRMSIQSDSPGNVGIGTSSPAYKLDVSGGARVTDLRIATTSAQAGYVWKATDAQGNGAWQIDATGLAGGQTNYIPVWTSATTQGTSTIYQNPLGPTGNVGIGTTNPVSLLHVSGTTGIGLLISGTAIDAQSFIKLTEDVGGLTASGIELLYDGGSNGLRFRDNSTAADIMAVKRDGNIGIGTRSPIYRLTVTDGSAPETSDAGIATPAVVSVQGDGKAYFMGRDVTNNIEFLFGTSVAGEAFAGAVTANDMSLRTNNTNRLTVKATTGNVGIGTMTPSSFFNIVSSSSGSGVSLFKINSNVAPNFTEFEIQSGADVYIGDGSSVIPNIRLTASNGGSGILTFAEGSVSSNNKIDFKYSANDDFLYIEDGQSPTLPIMAIGRVSKNIGVGSAAPGSKLTVVGGDVFVASRGGAIILIAQDGHCAKVQLSNSNALTVADVTCPTF